MASKFETKKIVDLKVTGTDDPIECYRIITTNRDNGRSTTKMYIDGQECTDRDEYYWHVREYDLPVIRTRNDLDLSLEMGVY